MQKKYFSILIETSIKPLVEVAVTKARSMLAFICRTFERLTPNIFIPAYSELVKPVIECHVQA